MPVGRTCVLDTSHIAFSSFQRPLSDACTRATGVIIGKQSHLEDSNRILYYFHCVALGLPSVYRSALKRDDIAAGESFVNKSASNEMTAKGSCFVSSDGYRYQLDGWYDKEYFIFSEEIKETEPVSVPNAWLEAIERNTSPCEVRYLCYAFHPWFNSPFESLNYLSLPERNRCYSVYICHRCLTPFFSLVHLTTHLDGYCHMLLPPGELVYLNPHTQQQVFFVDGARHLHYCRCASLIGKYFIESKLLRNDVDLYEFFVVTIPSRYLPLFPPAFHGAQPTPSTADQEDRDAFSAACEQYDRNKWSGAVVVGYFSRLKQCPNTLSCIVTFPPFQQWRLGGFLLDLAYRLTSIRQSSCGCEHCGQDGGRISRPFSPHGQATLLAYWARALKRSLAVGEVRAKASALEFESWEALRAAVDIPLHMDDLQFLMVHSENSFYSSVDSTSVEGAGDGDRDRVPSPSAGMILVASLVFETEATSTVASYPQKTSEYQRKLLPCEFDEKYLTCDKSGHLTYRKDLFHY